MSKISSSSIPIFAEVFAQLRNVRINPYQGKIPQDDYRDQPIVRDADYNLLGNSLGNPVYTNLTFLAGTYTDKNGNEINYPRLDFESVILTVSLPRLLVLTEIQGSDGRVKEYIGEDDAVITINGIIPGLNGHYPINEVCQLKEVIKAPVAIEVVSPFLNNLDIHNIVFQERDLPQIQGQYSMQAFTLNALSDTPRELRITNVS